MSPYLQLLLIDHFDAFFYAPFADRDYALYTPDESCDNLFDNDKQGIYFAISSDWPDSYSYISCYSCIVCFSRYVSWLAGILSRSNTSDSLHGDYMVQICNSGGR